MDIKQRIKQAKDRSLERVEVPEWAGDDGDPCVVYLQGLSAGQFDAIQRDINENFDGKESNRPNWQAWFVAKVLVCEDGTRIFEDGEEECLGEKNAKVIERLYKLAGKQNSVDKDSEEDLLKNSDAAHGEL